MASVLRSIPGIVFFFVLYNTTSAQDSINVIAANGKLPACRFFLKGETHEFPVENAKSLFDLLVYLHRHNSMHYLVMEMGPDHAFLANRYLQQETDSLHPNHRLYLGRVFWKKLFAFNKELPVDKKIVVLGFDFNRYIHTSQAFLIMFGTEPAVTDNELKSALKKIIHYDTVSWDFNKQKDFAGDIALVRKKVDENTNDLQKLLGDDFADLTRICHNEVASTPNVKRDKKVMESFIKNLPALNRGTFLFNYGISHISLDGIGLGHILSSDAGFKDNVCSIYPFYLKSDKRSATSRTIEKDIPASFRNEAVNYGSNTLIDLADKALYPRPFKKAQWLLVID